MRALAILCALVALLPAGAAAGADPTTAEIVEEVSRTERRGSRLVTLWWLPWEYWGAAARELGWKPEQIDAAVSSARPYLVMGVIDARVQPGKAVAFAEHLEIVNHLRVRIEGEPAEPLQRVDPELARLMPDLTYLLRVPLGPLSGGLRLLLFRNVDGDGKPLLLGGAPGLLSASYDMGEGEEPLEAYWRGPLTAVVGERRDPVTGEPLDASWKFNPWTGRRLDGDAVSP